MVYIGTFRSASYVVAKSKYSHHIRPNHLSMIQRAKTHNLLLQSSVMMAIEGSGHMCGSGLYELLVERDPSRGGFSHENRWAGEKGGSRQAGKALLEVSLCLNELQTSGEA